LDKDNGLISTGHRAQDKELRAQGEGHRAKSSGHRAQGTGHRAWSMGLGCNRKISVFESTDKGKWGDGDKEKKDRENKSTGHGAWSMGLGHNREISVFESTDKGKWGVGDKEKKDRETKSTGHFSRFLLPFTHFPCLFFSQSLSLFYGTVHGAWGKGSFV